MKQKVKIFKFWLFISILILGLIFFFGIIKNPNFNVLDFFTNLSSEMVGFFIVAVIFKFYFDEKKIVREIERRLEQENTDHLSASDLRAKINELAKIIDKEEPENTVSKDQGKVGFSVADELIKLRDLLNDGVITSEEFENIKSRYINENTPEKNSQ